MRCWRPPSRCPAQAFGGAEEKNFQAEGLFDDRRKKTPARLAPGPNQPGDISLPAPPSADRLKVLGERWPSAQICSIPARVQGGECAGRN